MGNEPTPAQKPEPEPPEGEGVWSMLYGSLFGPPPVEPEEVVPPDPLTQEAIAKYVQENQQAPGLVFGKALDQVLLQHNQIKVPGICYLAALHICQPKYISTQGLFRISGQRAEVFRLRQSFNEGNPVCFAGADVHDVCTILKQFIRELPDPLAPPEDFLPVCDLQDPALLLALMGTVPPQNATLLEFLCQLLRKISEHSEVNMMTVENLAIAIGPSIFPVEDNNPANFLNKTRQAIGVTDMLIRNHETIFSATEKQEFDLDNPVVFEPKKPVGEKPEEVNTQAAPTQETTPTDGQEATLAIPTPENQVQAPTADTKPEAEPATQETPKEEVKQENTDANANTNEGQQTQEV